MLVPNRPGEQTLSRIRTGLLIREARTSVGLTQSQLAERLHTTQSAVSNWERGADTPRVDTLGRILRACGFEADLVLRHRDDVDRSQIVRNIAMTPVQRARQFQSLADAHRRAQRATRVLVDG
jgi:transcriptional regulator with XRE-family HTH domain